ncbi:hypothetical protein N9R77_00540, partial [Candidatus Actinomarina sp.]|nr:hypothetical protein [Candidatus Actinomarina sp.]
MNSKKVISAVLLVSDGPVEHEYFEKLLTINNSELINLIINKLQPNETIYFENTNETEYFPLPKEL